MAGLSICFSYIFGMDMGTPELGSCTDDEKELCGTLGR